MAKQNLKCDIEILKKRADELESNIERLDKEINEKCSIKEEKLDGKKSSQEIIITIIIFIFIFIFLLLTRCSSNKTIITTTTSTIKHSDDKNITTTIHYSNEKNMTEVNK